MKILILVCALSVSAPDCQKATAIDQFYAPPTAEGLSGCLRQGMLYAAESNLVKAGNYSKVVCQFGDRGANLAKNAE